MGDIVGFPQPQADCIIRQNPDGRCTVMVNMTMSVEDTLFMLMAMRTLDHKTRIQIGKEVRLPFGVH